MKSSYLLPPASLRLFLFIALAVVWLGPPTSGHAQQPGGDITLEPPDGEPPQVDPPEDPEVPGGPEEPEPPEDPVGPGGDEPETPEPQYAPDRAPPYVQDVMDQTGATAEQVTQLRADGSGWGGVKHALTLAERVAADSDGSLSFDDALADITALRSGGAGWGDIAKQKGVKVGDVARKRKAADGPAEEDPANPDLDLAPDADATSATWHERARARFRRDKGERAEKEERAERAEKPGKPEKMERPSKPEKPSKPERPERPGKPERPERPGKPDKPEKPDRPEKGHGR